MIDYTYTGRQLDKRRIQTTYKHEASGIATAELYLDYIPTYDEHRRLTRINNRTNFDGSTHDKLARFDYTYDLVGNRLSNDPWRTSGTNAAGFSKMQEIPDIDYDGLHRLTQVDYDLGGGSTLAENFDYDDLGNRVTYYDHRNSITTAYANNVANEYTSIAGLAVLHDAAGNLSRQIVEIDGGTTKAYEYDYDHDNRLLAVDFTKTGESDVRAVFRRAAPKMILVAGLMRLRARCRPSGADDCGDQRYPGAARLQRRAFDLDYRFPLRCGRLVSSMPRTELGPRACTSGVVGCACGGRRGCLWSSLSLDSEGGPPCVASGPYRAFCRCCVSSWPDWAQRARRWRPTSPLTRGCCATRM